MPDAAGASAAGPATQWRVTGGHFDDDGSPGGLFDPDIEFPVDDPLGVNQPAPWSMLNQNPMFEPALPTVQHANGPNGAYAGVGGGPVSLPIIQDEMSTPRPPAYEPVATGAEASSSTMPVSGASFAGPSTGGLGGHLASAVAASGSGASTASMHGPPRSVAATTTTTTTATTPLPPTAAPATTQQPPHGGDGADADADEEDLDDEDMSMHHDDGDR